MTDLVDALSGFLQQQGPKLATELFEPAVIEHIPESALIMRLIDEAFPGHLELRDLVVEVKMDKGKPSYRPYRTPLAIVKDRWLSAAGEVDLAQIKQKIESATKKVLRNKGLPESSPIAFKFIAPRAIKKAPSQVAPGAWELLMEHRPAILACLQKGQIETATAPSVAVGKDRRL